MSDRITDKILAHSKRRNTKLAVGLLCILCILFNGFILQAEYDEANFWGDDNSYVSEIVSRSLTVHSEPTHHPFETLALTSQVDFLVDERLPYPDNEGHCNDILLYMPYEHAINGQGAQLNAYIKATILATFLNKALVILEADQFHVLPEWASRNKVPPRSLYDSGSQFGCPRYGASVDQDFPMGLSRLIQHPRWVGRGCPVPTCGGKMSYKNWEAERKQQKSFMRKNRGLHEMDCVEGDTHIKVTALGSSALIQAFTHKLGIQKKMLDRSTPKSRERARQWAKRLGASEREAQTFSEIKSANQIYDYLSALVNRSGLLRFQPWISQDVNEHVQSMGFRFDVPYDAFHVRRGDKLLREAKKEVQKFWRSNNRLGKQLIVNYIPFSYYIQKAWGKCTASDNVKRRNLKTPQVKTVYIATDDPATVHREINAIPRVNGKGASLVDQCNHKVNFVFAQTPEHAVFHINDRRTDDNCHAVYKRNIAAISDLVILARAQKFVGDYNSNWGRFIKVARSFLNDNGDKNMPHVITRPMIAAFGPSHPGVPGT